MKKKLFMDLPSFSLSSSRWSLHHFTAHKSQGSHLMFTQITLYGHDWPLLLMALLGWQMDVFKCLLVFLFNNVTWAFQNVIHIFVVTSDCPDLILLSCLRTTRQTLSLHYNQHSRQTVCGGSCISLYILKCFFECLSMHWGFLLCYLQEKHRNIEVAVVQRFDMQLLSFRTPF